MKPGSLDPVSYSSCHADEIPSNPHSRSVLGFLYGDHICTIETTGQHRMGSWNEEQLCTLFTSEHVTVIWEQTGLILAGVTCVPPFCSVLQPLGWFSHSSVEKSLTSKGCKIRTSLGQWSGFQGQYHTGDFYITFALRTHLPRRCVPTRVEVRLFGVWHGKSRVWGGYLEYRMRPGGWREENRAKEPKVRAPETFPLCPSSVAKQGLQTVSAGGGRGRWRSFSGVGQGTSCLPNCVPSGA